MGWMFLLHCGLLVLVMSVHVYLCTIHVYVDTFLLSFEYSGGFLLEVDEWVWMNVVVVYSKKSPLLFIGRRTGSHPPT